MNYHHPQFQVNSQFECTLEKAIGLSEGHQELARFGSSPFNPDRTHRWPARLSEERRRLLNNKKNARALAKRGDAAAQKRARKIECELGRLELEARQLHWVGQALTTRLAEVARTWSDAWIAFVKVVTEYENLRKQGIAPERHHLLALVWLKRHGAQSRVEIARRLWNGDRTPKDPEDIWIGGALWKQRIKYRSGSIWSVHCDLSERSLWQSDALRRAVRVRKSISFATSSAGGKVKHLWRETRLVAFKGRVFLRVASPWQWRDRAYNLFDLKRETFHSVKGAQRTAVLKAWTKFETAYRKDHSESWDRELARCADVLWQHDDASAYWQSKTRGNPLQISHVHRWKLWKLANGQEPPGKFDPAPKEAMKILRNYAERSRHRWKVSWCGWELVRRTLALNRATQPLPGLRSISQDRVRTVLSNFSMRFDERQHHAHVEAWLQHYICIGASASARISASIRQGANGEQLSRAQDHAEHVWTWKRAAVHHKKQKALRGGWSNPTRERRPAGECAPPAEEAVAMATSQRAADRTYLSQLVNEWIAAGGKVQSVHEGQTTKVRKVQWSDRASVEPDEKTTHEGDDDDKGRTIYLHDE